MSCETPAPFVFVLHYLLCQSQISNCMRAWGLRVLPQTLPSAVSAFHVFAAVLSAIFKSRAALQFEKLALRHQLGVPQRSVKSGGRLVKDTRHSWLMLAESHLTRRLFASIVRKMEALPVPTG